MIHTHAYAAYFDGWCKAVTSADPRFLTDTAKEIEAWRQAGGDVRLVTVEQAKADLIKWLDHRPEEQCPICGDHHEGQVPLLCQTGDGA